MRNVISHLAEFAEDQIKTLGPHARNYLRRCLDHWRAEYGEDVAKDLERRIRALMKKG